MTSDETTGTWASIARSVASGMSVRASPFAARPTLLAPHWLEDGGTVPGPISVCLHFSGTSCRRTL